MIQAFVPESLRQHMRLSLSGMAEVIAEVEALEDHAQEDHT